MFELDRDTALRPAGAPALEAGARYTLELSDGWGIYGIPNGGYLAALATRALEEALPFPDPLTFTAHYLRPAEPGPMVVEVEVIRAGRTSATGQARLLQGGKERVRALATFGDLDAHEGPTHERGAAPPVPPRDACLDVRGPPPGSTFADRVDLLFAPGSAAFASEQTGPPEIGGWVRTRDGRPLDPRALVLFADAWPPPVLNLVPRVWVPTLELTVHVRRRPRGEWVQCWFTTSHLIDGALGTDGELWDDSGRLVAVSRQLARLKSP